MQEKEEKKRKPRWSKEEDQLLAEAVNREGTTSWALIAQSLPGRSGKQCRERYYNKLDPSISSTKWTEEEDTQLIRLHKQLGNRWAEIARLLGGTRPSNTIKNRWNSRLRKLSQSAIDDDIVETPKKQKRKRSPSPPPPEEENYSLQEQVQQFDDQGSSNQGLRRSRRLEKKDPKYLPLPHSPSPPRSISPHPNLKQINVIDYSNSMMSPNFTDNNLIVQNSVTQATSSYLVSQTADQQSSEPSFIPERQIHTPPPFIPSPSPNQSPGFSNFDQQLILQQQHQHQHQHQHLQQHPMQQQLQQQFNQHQQQQQNQQPQSKKFQQPRFSFRISGGVVNSMSVHEPKSLQLQANVPSSSAVQQNNYSNNILHQSSVDQFVSYQDNQQSTPHQPPTPPNIHDPTLISSSKLLTQTVVDQEIAKLSRVLGEVVNHPHYPAVQVETRTITPPPVPFYHNTPPIDVYNKQDTQNVIDMVSTKSEIQAIPIVMPDAQHQQHQQHQQQQHFPPSFTTPIISNMFMLNQLQNLNNGSNDSPESSMNHIYNQIPNQQVQQQHMQQLQPHTQQQQQQQGFQHPVQQNLQYQQSQIQYGSLIQQQHQHQHQQHSDDVLPFQLDNVVQDDKIEPPPAKKQKTESNNNNNNSFNVISHIHDDKNNITIHPDINNNSNIATLSNTKELSSVANITTTTTSTTTTSATTLVNSHTSHNDDDPYQSIHMDMLSQQNRNVQSPSSSMFLETTSNYDPSYQNNYLIQKDNNYQIQLNATTSSARSPTTTTTTTTTTTMTTNDTYISNPNIQHSFDQSSNINNNIIGNNFANPHTVNTNPLGKLSKRIKISILPKGQGSRIITHNTNTNTNNNNTITDTNTNSNDNIMFNGADSFVLPQEVVTPQHLKSTTPEIMVESVNNMNNSTSFNDSFVGNDHHHQLSSSSSSSSTSPPSSSVLHNLTTLSTSSPLRSLNSSLEKSSTSDSTIHSVSDSLQSLTTDSNSLETSLETNDAFLFLSPARIRSSSQHSTPEPINRFLSPLQSAKQPFSTNSPFQTPTKKSSAARKIDLSCKESTLGCDFLPDSFNELTRSWGLQLDDDDDENLLDTELTL
eukprot:TRINITY_DN6608_c3_g1_i1.p1 TRINITY_DN6608_c3_g1~~TRINITY_DN6608_c3_g1_i1.p1  ORF type:complete len:1090 (+),score=370.49 TRINITY_DN6608_c3_g1_i1:131-3400(+)